MSKGTWIVLSGGKRFCFKKLEKKDGPLDTWDIVNGLSRVFRFSGQAPVLYSVAQHSCYVADLVPEKYKLHALLHDATECVLGDVSGPLKSLLPDYRAIEKRLQEKIFKIHGLGPSIPKEVKTADVRVLVTEFNEFFGRAAAKREFPKINPAKIKIDSIWGYERARQELWDRIVRQLMQKHRKNNGNKH